MVKIFPIVKKVVSSSGATVRMGPFYGATPPETRQQISFPTASTRHDIGQGQTPAFPAASLSMAGPGEGQSMALRAAPSIVGPGVSQAFTFRLPASYNVAQGQHAGVSMVAYWEVPGTYTYVVDRTGTILLDAWAAGGQGGIGSATNGGGGAGGAGFSSTTALAVTAGDTLTIKVGSNTLGATAAQKQSWVSKTGVDPTSTSEGVLANGGGNGGDGGVAANGTAGAAGSVTGAIGDTKRAGGAGAAGQSTSGGGGGGGAGTNNPGNAASGTGGGGAAVLGGGSGGTGGGATATGAAGSNYGGGAGGSGSGVTGGAIVHALGGTGAIRLTTVIA